jgi:outer membrane receptor protein involved in Fe transport
VTWFDNRLTNPVLNVTLSPTLAQKQNIPETKVQGVQTDIDYRLGASWRFFAAYVYDNAKVTDGGPANAALNGKWLQQVPENRGSFQVAYSNVKYATVTLGVQIVGLQYNDDLNVNFIPPATLASAGYDNVYPAGLPGFTSVDLNVAHNFTPNIQAFFGMQNMLNKTYFVQTNPSTIGTPRLANVGMRIRFSGH